MQFRSILATLVVMLSLALSVPVMGQPKEGPPPGSFKLALGLKAQQIQGLSFEIKPTVVVLNDREATITVHEDKEKGVFVSLTVLPRKLPNHQVDLSISFLVRHGEYEVARETRFVTQIGQKGSFSVSDSKTGEHFKIEVTPSLTK